MLEDPLLFGGKSSVPHDVPSHCRPRGDRAPYRTQNSVSCADPWIGELERHAGASGRPTIFKDAMTTLSFRVEQSLKEDVNLLAECLTRRVESKSSAGCSGQSFHCLWPGTDASAVPRFREVSGTAAHPEVTMRRSYRKHSRQKIGNHRHDSDLLGDWPTDCGGRAARKKRAEYGEALLKKLASDLTARFGKGFGLANLKSIRKFFLTWPEKQIGQTVSGQSASQLTPLSSEKGQTLSDLSSGGQGIARLRVSSTSEPPSRAIRPQC